MCPNLLLTMTLCCTQTHCGGDLGAGGPDVGFTVTREHFSCREEGVDRAVPQQHSSGHSSDLIPSETSRHDFQLQRFGRTTTCHRIWVGTVPTGSGLQLQEVPSF